MESTKKVSYNESENKPKKKKKRDKSIMKRSKTIGHEDSMNVTFKNWE